MLAPQFAYMHQGRKHYKVFKSATTTHEAINAFAQHMKQTHNIDALNTKYPFDIKYVPCND